MRQNIKDNLNEILDGKIKIDFVPALRQNIKDKNLIGKYECKECGCNGTWNGKLIELDLDHIDGDKTNNFRENLRWLCPNCHSQTKTWKIKNAKNIKTSHLKDQKFIDSIKQGGSMSDILRRLNLRAGGDNYNRIHKIIERYKLNIGSEPGQSQSL